MTNEQLIVSGDISGLWDSLCRFVYQQAYRFCMQYNERCVSAGVTLDDLIQYAYIIMVKAVELYKPDTYKFTTYYGKVLYRSYQRLIRKNKFVDSLDKLIDSDDIYSDTLIDITADPDGEADMDNIVESEYQRELQRDVQLALDTLSDDERDVIHERFWNNKSLKDLSEIHGTTPQEVRSVESKALQRLRNPKAEHIPAGYHQYVRLQR